MLRSKLDEIDSRILAELQANARLRNVELAEKVGLSASPCLRRVRRLEELGIIKGYATLVDQQAVNLPVSVFIQVTLEKQIEPALELFERQIREWPEVMECYLMTGEADYMLRVVTEDLREYQKLVLECLTQIPVVSTIRSSFALDQIKYTTALPTGHLRA